MMSQSGMIISSLERQDPAMVMDHLNVMHLHIFESFLMHQKTVIISLLTSCLVGLADLQK